MSEFAASILGAWPVYPGHPCSLALCILRKYPRIADAYVVQTQPDGGPTHPVALGDGDIPGGGGCVYQALDLIQRVRDGLMTPVQAIAWGADAWHHRTVIGRDHPDRYAEGVAEYEHVAPLLLVELQRVAAVRVTQ